MPMDLLCRLQSENRRLKELITEDLHIEKLLYENGRLELSATHPLGAAVIAALVSVFASSSGENFFEMHCNHPKTGPLCVTIQRMQGKTPGQVAGELRAKVEELEKVTPCTFPDCMSARAVRAAGEEYQRGVVEGLRLAVEAAEDIPTTVSVHATAHDASVATRCKEAIVMAIGAVREPSTKDGVCEWTKAEIDHHGNEFWKPSCDKAPTFYFCGPFGFYQFHFCPYCGRTVKEAK